MDAIEQKARELYGFFYVIIQKADKYSYLLSDEEKEFSKQAAIKCVDEILNLSYFTHEPTEDDILYRNHFQHLKEKIQSL